jgi:hypothetical protein
MGALWAKWRRTMDGIEAKRKATEQRSAKYAPEEHDEFGRPVRRVVVTDFDMPFLSIVSLLVKLALASIPALIILGLAFKLWELFIRIAPGL